MKRDPNNKKPTKLLTAVTALLLAVGIVADVAMFGVFPSSLDKAFPGQNGDPELQKTSYANGLSVAQKIEEEGAVLLKNDGALPLAGTNRKSIFWAMLPQIRFMAVRVPVAAATLQTGQIL